MKNDLKNTLLKNQSRSQGIRFAEIHDINGLTGREIRK